MGFALLWPADEQFGSPHNPANGAVSASGAFQRERLIPAGQGSVPGYWGAHDSRVAWCAVSTDLTTQRQQAVRISPVDQGSAHCARSGSCI